MASSKIMMKIAQIARMRVAGIKDISIARHLLMTNSGLQRILRLPLYQEYEEAVFAGKISKMDEALSQDAKLMRQTMKVAVPAALRTIVETALQRRDLKAALAASQDILNRDPDRNFTLARDSVIRSEQNTGLPAALFEAISKDADGVAVSVKAKLQTLASSGKTDS